MAKREHIAPERKTPKRPTPPDAIPRRIVDPTLNDHLEVMTRAIFQAGLSWAMIAARWDAFLLAFDRFEVAVVAAYGEFEIEGIMAAEGVVHSRKKIVGTVANANALLALERDLGGVGAYVAGFDSYARLFADARKRFAFLGDLSCYYWLFRTGNHVPPFEQWIARQDTDHPRMREMVMTARAQGVSPERAGF